MAPRAKKKTRRGAKAAAPAAPAALAALPADVLQIVASKLVALDKFNRCTFLFFSRDSPACACRRRHRCRLPANAPLQTQHLAAAPAPAQRGDRVS